MIVLTTTEIKKMLSQQLFDLVFEKEQKTGKNQTRQCEEMKINKGTFSKWLNDKTPLLPCYENLFVICDYYNVSLDYLFGKTTKKSKDVNIASVCSSLSLSENFISLLFEIKKFKKMTLQQVNALVTECTAYSPEFPLLYDQFDIKSGDSIDLIEFHDESEILKYNCGLEILCNSCYSIDFSRKFYEFINAKHTKQHDVDYLEYELYKSFQSVIADALDQIEMRELRQKHNVND